MEPAPLQESVHEQHTHLDETKEKQEKKKRHKKRTAESGKSPDPLSPPTEVGDPALDADKRAKSKTSRRKPRDAVASVSPGHHDEVLSDANTKGETGSPLQQEAQSPQTPQEQPQQPQLSTQPAAAGSAESQEQQQVGKQPTPADKPVAETADVSIRPSLAAIIAACLLAVIAISISVVIFNLFDRSVGEGCVYAACKEVLEYMDAIVDRKVKPCNDFYRHVCGHWLPRETSPTPTPAPPTSSFMADVLRNYTARRHREMMARESWAEPADSVSRYYVYCVAYNSVPRTLQETVEKLFEVTGITVAPWQNISMDAAVADLVRLTYVYRLHSLFRITTRKDDFHTYLEIDRWTSFKRRLPNIGNDSQDNAFLESVLNTIAGKDANATVVKECLALDDSIGLKETRGHNSPPGPISADDCTEFPPQKWVTLVNAVQDAPKLPANVTVIGREFKDACSDIMSVFLHVEMPVKALYPLALVAVNVLKLDYMLASGSKLEPELVQKVCHQDTMAVFKRLWLPSLTKILSISSDTALTVGSYFSVFKTAMEQRIDDDLKWMSEVDQESTLLNAKGLQMSAFINSSLSEQEIGDSRFNPSFGMRENDWIFNKVTVLKRLKLADDADDDADAVRDDDDYADTVEVELAIDPAAGKITVPHMFAVPPVFFDDLSGASYPNIALLGVQMARKMLGLLIGSQVAGYSWSNETATAYSALRKCYADRSAAFHAPLETEQQFDEAVAAALAIKLAYRYRPLMGEGSSVDDPKVSSEGLFFKRACLSLCAGGQLRQDFNSLERDVASAACTLAASSMPEFHKTFRCRDQDPMAAPKLCTF
ncbi:uncharacterized protein [Dermacentor albipictus]|uniref:uncharacterized protein isoform X1 n=1 Tax=Dermacentor albipictus TaxID=60249 RepID=UPI0038FCCD95